MGGGSVAALCAALSAALLEKLVVQPQAAQQLRRIQRSSLALMPRDARVFSKVIQATRRGGRRNFRRALKTATEVPWQVFAHAQAVQRMCRQAQRSVKPRFQSDLRCALAVALAASESARTLIETNLAWLNDAAYTRRMRRRLQSATSRNSR
jgi:formiminotetrahydrofolate cyclodeaminase